MITEQRARHLPVLEGGKLAGLSRIPPSPSLEDGLKAQLLADKATESLKSGQPVKFAK